LAKKREAQRDWRQKKGAGQNKEYDLGTERAKRARVGVGAYKLQGGKERTSEKNTARGPARAPRVE